MTPCSKFPPRRRIKGMVAVPTLAIAIFLAACQTARPPETRAVSPEAARTAPVAADSRIASAKVSDRTSSRATAAPPAKSGAPAETAPAPGQPGRKSAGIGLSDEMLLRLMENDTSGPQCREFEQTVKIDDKTETAYGAACRQPDGAWKRVGSMQPPETVEEPRSKAARHLTHEGRPQRRYPHDYRGYAPFFLGLGLGADGGHIGYGVYY